MNIIQYERKNFEKLSPYAARFGNFFFCFDIITAFDFYGKTVHIRPLFDKKFDPCAFVLVLKVGTSLWNIAFQKEDILLFHPAIKNASEIKQNFSAFFPLEVRQALLESVFAPFAESLSQKLGIKIAVENIELAEKNFAYSACLAFAFEETGENAYENIFYVQIPEEQQSLQVLEKLEQLLAPEQKERETFSALEIPLAFCVGQTELTVQDLQNAACGDYILCDEYYPKNAQIRLYPCIADKEISGARDYLLGTVNDTKIEIVEWVHACKKEGELLADVQHTHDNGDKDKDMNENKTQNTAEKAENSSQDNLEISVGNISVTVQFSLAQRAIPLQELQHINAGYVFALENDFLAPVTLFVNGKSIGKGKIVDINGTVGVQIVEINK